jgi:hypothetical protein
MGWRFLKAEAVWKSGGVCLEYYVEYTIRKARTRFRTMSLRAATVLVTPGAREGGADEAQVLACSGQPLARGFLFS